MLDLLQKEKKMTSLEIAELTGKSHNDVLKAIRAMEPAWERITQGKFSLSEYKDSTGRTLPCYELTKRECLYIATKFNDEARAKLVIRWEQLEMERQFDSPSYLIDDEIERAKVWIQERQLLLVAQKKADYADKVLSTDKLFPTKMIALDYGMTAADFNRLLYAYGIQYKEGKHWYLYKKYLDKGYAGTETYLVDTPKEVAMTMKWTQKGRQFLYEFLSDKGIKPVNKLF